MQIISRASLYTYENGNLMNATVMPWKPDDEESAYLSGVAEKLMQSDGTRVTHLTENSEDGELFQAFIRQPFAEAIRDLIRIMDERITEKDVLLDESDIAVFSFEWENDPHLCIARLQWKKAVAHREELDEEGQMVSRLQRTSRIMPPPGGRECSGMVINLSDGAIRLRDTQVPTGEGGKVQFFGEVLFAMEETKTEKASVEVVRTILREIAPEPEVVPAIKREMDRSIEETGSIDVRDVVERIFVAEPEHEQIVSRVMEKVEEEQVAPVIPVENKRVRASLQKIRIRTDTGISITLPRELADDASSFSVVNNDDGSISIVINRIMELQTE